MYSEEQEGRVEERGEEDATKQSGGKNQISSVFHILSSIVMKILHLNRAKQALLIISLNIY